VPSTQSQQIQRAGEMMNALVFWDVDTQRDFIEPDGRLYVPGAEQLLPNLQRLTHFARQRRIQVVADICDHTMEDEEISAHPNFKTTFPPHCIRGTRGHEKVDATAPLHPLYIDNRPYERDELARLVEGHEGEIIIKKQALDVFSNPATEILVDVLSPRLAVVYGVALDVCVNLVVVGLSERGCQVNFVADASKPIDAREGETCVRRWRGRGVRVVTTADIVEGRVTLRG
jgi:nicotinamidase/pyrazinamidase